MRSGRAWALEAIVISVAVWLLSASPAQAGQPAAIEVSAGQFSALRGSAAHEIGWELGFASRRFRWLPRVVPGLSPTVGAMATAKGTLYVYGGFRCDLPLGKTWRWSPQLATGVFYRYAGHNLGGALEFRSGIEVSRRLGERAHLGLTLYHLSNAGLFDSNPGSESLVLTFSTRP